MRNVRFVVLGFLFSAAFAQPPQSPPTAFGPVESGVIGPSRPREAAPAGLIAWDIGQPTDEEQMMVEQINRARANPVAEAALLQALPDSDIQFAYSYYKVDFAKFATDMAAYPPLPPLAPNALLMQAARGHSLWMLTNAIQAHFEGTNGPLQRVMATGYVPTIVGENVYAYADNPVYCHAGFEVDWGLFDNLGQPIAPGMQSPPGHRENNHDSRFTEIGVGVVKGSNSSVAGGTVGPQLYTIDTANRSGAFPFVTGAAYFDLNSNGRYDAGEGVSGVRVDVADSGYFATTTVSGGYAVPTSEGQHAVTFSAPGMSNVTVSATISGGRNAKADLRLSYVAPTLQGPSAPGVGFVNAYQPSAVPAATAYNWAASRRTPVTAALGAENGQEGVSLQTTAGYQPIQTTFASAGTHSYRLTMPDGTDQILRLTNRYSGGNAPVLGFSVAFGYTTADQTLLAEISGDGGTTWTSIWSGSGPSEALSPAFAAKSVPLAGYAQREFQLRFRFAVPPAGGSYYPGTASSEGVYIDAIALADTYTVADVGSGTISATGAVPFNPPSVGDYVLSVQPQVGSRTLSWGPALAVKAVIGIHLARPVIGPNGKVRVDFAAQGGTTPGGFFLERLTAFGGTWQTDSAAVLSVVSPGNWTFRTDPPVGGIALYRVSAR